MKWITRERPKIDRIACPWLIARFIDKEPEFLYVPSGDVVKIAGEAGAVPYDIPGVELSHVGELCSFDAFLDKYHLNDPAMGKALGGGSGWVLLTYSPRDKRLVNQWAPDHAHTLAGASPIIALDMYEHSYHMDFGAKAAAYVDAFMQNIHWTRAADRFAAVQK